LREKERLASGGTIWRGWEKEQRAWGCVAPTVSRVGGADAVGALHVWFIWLGCRAALFDFENPVSDLPACPLCKSAYTYQDGEMLVCPECAHEWAPAAAAESAEAGRVHKDSVGNVLADGDSVTVIKDLKVKGASSALKAGTKVRNIRLVDEDHDIDCKIDGFGAMKLKSEFVKKA
jgi:protein PhnA